MKVLMLPHITDFKNPGSESGIRRVIEAYFEHLPKFGVDLVNMGDSYDILAVHAGCYNDYAPNENLVCHNHGMYWTADYEASKWEHSANANVIESIRHAREVTVPSSWVAETFQRDMHFTPHVIPHGINWNDWQENTSDDGYIIGYNKNRKGMDVCNPANADELARRTPDLRFINTFSHDNPENVTVTGLIQHDAMKELVQHCSVFVSTTKETGGIGILEAMASGKPIVGFAQGGILDWCQHGVNSYLAEPGNMVDLENGLRYCLEHRDVLGKNSRELAKRFTWEKVCEKVAEVYKLAMVSEQPTAAIIIPSYQYGNIVDIAVKSAIRQTYEQLVDIIVVDDGSDDDGLTERTVNGLHEVDDRVQYIRKPNGGVATARNLGIANTDAKYICCLDADDQIAPTFLETLIPHLEADNSLGLVYGGLKLLIPQNDEILERDSRFPPECDFNKQVTGNNQVPTCNVFRRKCWKRLGGYRQRYAPNGAGTEDAEFWLRIGSYGWGIKQVTKEPLFYYLLGGRTTGDRSYKEVNYLQWHPWTIDKQYPFASIATPSNRRGNHSHLVRQYNEPVVSVIIPVGPGHEVDVIDALDSLEAQTYRKWEAVVVDDTGSNDLDLSAFPFVRVFKTEGKIGAGYARNRGMDIARAPYTLFLDADDWLYPDAIYKLLEECIGCDGNVAVYGDHNGLAVIDEEHAHQMEREHRLLQYRQSDGHALMRFFRTDYDWMRAVQQPSKNGQFYIWCNITTLIPTSWHHEIGGFDEQMESWEDWDYWIRLARAGKCFVRINEPLFVYRYFSGNRRWQANPDSPEGLQLARNLVQYMVEKYAGGEIVGCGGGCGGKGSKSSVHDYASKLAGTTQTGVQRNMSSMKDEDFVLTEYLGIPPGNISNHGVVGVAIFNEMLQSVPMIRRGGGWSIDYRYRKAGDRFLVHRLDVEKSPNWFRIVEFDKKEFQSVLPKRQVDISKPPEPKPIAEILSEAIIPLKQEADTRATTSEPKSIVPQEVEVEITEAEAVESLKVAVLTRGEIELLPGVTPGIAEQIANDGVKTYQDILNLGVDGLKQYRGVGEARAMSMIDAINAMAMS